jgi:hypothetical protein
MRRITTLYWGGGKRVPYRFFVVGVGASAVSPDVVYADNDGEHGEESGAKRGGLWKAVNVLGGRRDGHHGSVY